MIKSFQIPWDNNTKETVEYEDDITFGELEGILNQCLDVTQIQDPKVNLPLYRQLILTTVIRKAPFEVRDTAAIKNLRSSVAKTIMTEVMKDYPLAKYLEEWVETFVGQEITEEAAISTTSSQGNSVGRKTKSTRSQ